jgi:hypothetical protein
LSDMCSFLVYFAHKHIEQGYDVRFVSIETPDYKIKQRLEELRDK